MIVGENNDWPEIFHNMETLYDDLEYLESRYSGTKFKVLEREVGEWKEIEEL